MGFSSFAKKVAPWITTAVGIAVPGAAPFANIAAKLLSSGLNKTVAPNPDAISTAIAEAMASPEQLAALKQIDDQFALQCKTLGIQSAEDFEKIAADDRSSARDMEIKTGDKWTPRILAGVVTIGFFSVLYLMIRGGLPPTGHDALLVMLGALGTAWTAIISYYFGSSAGSAEKTSALTQIAKQQ